MSDVNFLSILHIIYFLKYSKLLREDKITEITVPEDNSTVTGSSFSFYDSVFDCPENSEMMYKLFVDLALRGI